MHIIDGNLILYNSMVGIFILDAQLKKYPVKKNKKREKNSFFKKYKCLKGNISTTIQDIERLYRIKHLGNFINFHFVLEGFIAWTHGSRDISKKCKNGTFTPPPPPQHRGYGWWLFFCSPPNYPKQGYGVKNCVPHISLYTPFLVFVDWTNLVINWHKDWNLKVMVSWSIWN